MTGVVKSSVTLNSISVCAPLHAGQKGVLFAVETFLFGSPNTVTSENAWEKEEMKAGLLKGAPPLKGTLSRWCPLSAVHSRIEVEGDIHSMISLNDFQVGGVQTQPRTYLEE